MHWRTSVRLGLFSLTALLGLSQARADTTEICSERPPRIYTATTDADAGTVTICADPNHGDYPCSASAPLLRQNESTGAVVSLTTCSSSGCYVDSCVPDGTYRYGLATPFTCTDSACATYYYTSVTVSGLTDSDASSCTSTATAYDGGVPWGASWIVCTYSGGCGSSTAGSVLTVNGLVGLFGALLLWAAHRRRAALRK